MTPSYPEKPSSVFWPHLVSWSGIDSQPSSSAAALCETHSAAGRRQGATVRWPGSGAGARVPLGILISAGPGLTAPHLRGAAHALTC